MSDEDYCTIIDSTESQPADGPPYAECVLCRKPTEYPASYRGARCARCDGGSPCSSEVENLGEAGGAAHGLLRVTGGG
ncbi:hypothetical protein AB0I54_04615 [Streptomyces sp. NPDC050625]|uniref:hypothetical protein n=1 Tax=Streptomyces sp. NPDC050625 TaxID=3154629 RepID=UPI0034451A4C